MPTTTQITVTELDMNGVRCQALFSSGLLLGLVILHEFLLGNA